MKILKINNSYLDVARNSTESFEGGDTDFSGEGLFLSASEENSLLLFGSETQVADGLKGGQGSLGGLFAFTFSFGVELLDEGTNLSDGFAVLVSFAESSGHGRDGQVDFGGLHGVASVSEDFLKISNILFRIGIFFIIVI